MAEQQGQPEQKRRQQRRKRAHGEGSVFELKGRDRKKPWVAQITLENGKKKQTYHVTQQEAIAARRKMLNELEQGLLATSSRQTVKQYLEHWLENVQSPPQVRVSTYEMYRRLLKNHILPALGHLPLSRLTPQHVQAFYADKLKAGLSPRTVQIMHALLHKALENAVRWRLVPRNICEDVSSPRATRYEMQSLTRDQAQRLMEAARGHRFEVLLLLALVTGMRRGELLSLRWKDVNLEEKCLILLLRH